MAAGDVALPMPSRAASPRTSARVWAAHLVPDPVLVPAFALGTFLLIARGWQRLRKPGLWAEDGTHFFADSHAKGIHSIFIQFEGYVHVVPRLIALGLTPLPLTAVPEAFTLAAVIATALIFATVLSSRLAWLVPSRLARGLIFVLLCVLPDFSEPYGNLANLIFVGATALFFLGLSNDPRTRAGRLLEPVVVLAFMLSGPLGLATAPVFVHRFWRMRSKHAALVLVTFVLGGAWQTDVYLHSTRMTPGGGTVGIYARAAALRLPGTYLLGGEHWHHAWVAGHLRDYGTAWLLVVIVVALLLLRGAGLAILAVGGLALLLLVHAYGPLVLGAGYDRHFVLPQVVAVTASVAAAATCTTRLRALARRRGSAERGARPVRHGPRLAVLAALAVISIAPAAAGVVGISRDARLTAYSNRPDMALLQPCLKSLSGTCSTSEAPTKYWIVRFRYPSPPKKVKTKTAAARSSSVAR